LRPAFSLVLVTDRCASPVPVPDAVRAALAELPPGAAAVQLREKDLEGRALAELARALLLLCRAHETPLLVNDRLDVAIAVGAQGVQLARTSVGPAEARSLLGPAALIGVSCHSTGEVREALGPADFALFGPIFDTPSKRAYGPPLGVGALAEAAKLGLPLYAVGGVTAERTRELAGARGVAAIGSGLGARDPATAVKRLWSALGHLPPSSRGT